MRITEIRSTPLFVPYKKPFHWAQGSIDGAYVVLLEVLTDEGIAGYGECVSTPSARGIREYIAEASKLLITAFIAIAFFFSKS